MSGFQSSSFIQIQNNDIVNGIAINVHSGQRKINEQRGVQRPNHGRRDNNHKNRDRQQQQLHRDDQPDPWPGHRRTTSATLGSTSSVCLSVCCAEMCVFCASHCVIANSSLQSWESWDWSYSRSPVWFSWCASCFLEYVIDLCVWAAPARTLRRRRIPRSDLCFFCGAFFLICACCLSCNLVVLSYCA